MAVGITRTADPAGVNHSSNVTTYSGAATGTASGDRVTFLAVMKEVATVTASSATMDNGGGDVAMVQVGSGITFGNMGVWLFWLPNQTGTTATFKVTWSGAITNVQNHVFVYAATDAAMPPFASGTNSSTDMDSNAPLTTGSITIATGGGVLAVAAGGTDAAAGNKTWAGTGTSEDRDVDAGDFQATAAINTTAGTTTITCTGGTNGEDGVMIWVNLRQSSTPGLPPVQPNIRL